MVLKRPEGCGASLRVWPERSIADTILATVFLTTAIVINAILANAHGVPEALTIGVASRTHGQPNLCLRRAYLVAGQYVLAGRG